MTAIATSRAQSVRQVVSSQSTNPRVNGIPSLPFRKLRQVDSDLVEDAISFSRKTEIEYKVIDLVSIYKTVMEMRVEIHSTRIPICDAFLDEVETCLRYFLDHKILPARKISVSQILR